jgi:hypothetical protein
MRAEQPTVYHGAEAYMDSMKRFPRLTEAETQIVLHNEQAHQTVGELRAVVPFSHRLQEEVPQKGGPYTELFREARTNAQFIGLGRFDLIETIARRFAVRFPHLVDTEAFMQESVVETIPSAIATYNPELGKLESYLYRALQFDMLNRIVSQQRKKSLPVRHEKKRLPIESLESVLDKGSDTDGQTMRVEIQDKEAEEPYGSVERYDALQQVYRSAGLNEPQRDAVTHMTINEEPQQVLARERYLLPRSLRFRRDAGVQKIRALGEVHVRAIFRGEQT